MSWFDHGEARVYYEEDGSGDPLLLIPGWGGSIDEVRQVREALARSYRVIAADPPGSGKSGPQPRTFTASYYFDDAPVWAALLEQLARQPAHIVGFSDGGEYALILAERHPKLVRSVAAWGAAGQIKAPPELYDAMEHLIDNPIPPMQEFSNGMKAMYGADNARVMTQSFGKALREIDAAGGDLSYERAGEIACPVLLITGEHDFIAPPALTKEIAARIPGAEYVEVAGAGHPVQESHGDWLAETLVAWLAKH